ncbi:MAG: DUF4474 domain-containing protein [Clostridia bacterium]|nr:DUF4474 domain-containing protein [Clostridia bacterium]
MKKTAVKITAVFFVLMFAFSSVVSAYAVATPTDPVPDAGKIPALVMMSESLTVTEGKTVQMTAKVTNVSAQPRIRWASSDVSVATVDSNGVVSGKALGKAVITASAVVNGETLRGEYVINVVKEGNFLKDFLEDRQVLSYQYSYIDDYYYTNDKEAWQYNFGFGKIYDIASPYLLLEYDYIRIFFIYGDKDWMLQMWKGQYGMIFYGGEIGIYNRDHVDDGMNEWTFFNCPAEEDWLMMEMTLWHEEIDGSWTREFTREYDKYWWCTGFKNGHLRVEEPADELRMTGRITFKDDVMAGIVADGLKECGFKVSSSKNNIGLDEFNCEGSDIRFCWQNISEAESTMAIKVVGGALSALYLMPLWPVILPFVRLFAVAAILVSFIL